MKYIPLLPIFMLLSVIYSTKGMQEELHFPGQLNEIEKLIVWLKMQKISKKTTLDMLQPITDRGYTKDESKTFPTLTKIRKNSSDTLSLFIIQAIKEQEEEYGYVPEQISEKKDGVWHITIPTNYLGNYTRYWHKKDSKGEYIELYSSFIYKPALLEVIHNYAT